MIYIDDYQLRVYFLVHFLFVDDKDLHGTIFWITLRCAALREVGFSYNVQKGGYMK